MKHFLVVSLMTTAVNSFVGTSVECTYGQCHEQGNQETQSGKILGINSTNNPVGKETIATDIRHEGSRGPSKCQNNGCGKDTGHSNQEGFNRLSDGQKRSSSGGSIFIFLFGGGKGFHHATGGWNSDASFLDEL